MTDELKSTPAPAESEPGKPAQKRQTQVAKAKPAHGDSAGKNANPITLIMDRDRSFVANFDLLESDSIYLPLIRQGR